MILLKAYPWRVVALSTIGNVSFLGVERGKLRNAS